ncbi:hypothetical protein [Nonomuraea africana]|uniref:DUF5753 domain-containing protein n=1 Tax=Nonomuraea africana TaxID=46171 RepID=A0ABR9KW47_9ACTN|nr:hypothetical protein [Nonomuraea africana]MBE1566258.1 hypothetical protein [Nonomuraea africana]
MSPELNYQMMQVRIDELHAAAAHQRQVKEARKAHVAERGGRTRSFFASLRTA